MWVIEFLVIVILGGVQEVGVGTGLLFVWVVATSVVREPEKLFGWVFGAGIMADLLAGRHLGVSALMYLIAAGLLVKAKARVPRQSRFIVSVLVGGLLVVWQLVTTQAVNLGEVAVELVGFWLLLPVAEILSQDTERKTFLRLKQ